jgi:hypothetical protein
MINMSARTERILRKNMMRFSNFNAAKRSILTIVVAMAGLLPGSAQAQSYLYNDSFVSAGYSASVAIFADFNKDGRQDLATLNGDNTVSIILGEAYGRFAVPVNYPVGSSPFALIAVDLTGNGKTDLVTVNTPNGIDQPGTLSVLLGNGDGTFKTHVDYFVGDFPEGVVAGDFNGDGKIDLAVANNFDNTISILYGNGDGTFQSQVTVAVDPSPTAIGSGDFNGDGREDLIASCVGTGVVSVLLNNGNGTFTLVDSPDQILGVDRNHIVVSDFNEDGKQDVAISSQLGQIYLLEGKGNGSFKSAIPLVNPSLGEIESLIAADVNHDGKMDLSYGFVAPGSVAVILGKGNGTFQKPVISPVASIASLAVADVNGDGHLDLAVPDGELSSVAISLGDGNGGFGIPKTFNLSGTSTGPGGAVTGDFNGDGKLDLAVIESSFPTGQVAVALGTGKGTFGNPILSPLLSEGINNEGRIVTGDFNGDGKLDLIVEDDYLLGFQVLLGNGDGRFQAPVDTNLNTPLSFAVGDFNSDGKTDVAVATSLNAQSLISIYLSNGDGTFRLGEQYTEAYGAINVGDVNHDGKLDLVILTFGEPLLVLLGNGDGTFQKAISGPAAIYDTNGVIQDFDGDGIADIVVGTYSGPAFLKGNGDGTFQNPVYSNATLQMFGFDVAADINGDGKLDLVNNVGTFAMLGNGDGTFQPPFGYSAVGEFGVTALAGDFNSDGIADLEIVTEDLFSGATTASLYASGPTIDLFPTAINFGTVKVGQISSAVKVQVANAGNGVLSLASITVSGDFTEQNNCGTKLAIGATCTVEVRFKPATTGMLSGAVTFKDNALSGSQLISLKGTGK